MWCICTPAYKSLGTSVPRSGVVMVTLSRFGESCPPCARCSVGHLCLLKLVLNTTSWILLTKDMTTGSLNKITVTSQLMD